eukprot:1361839-Rhodomonas_salina.1
MKLLPAQLKLLPFWEKQGGRAQTQQREKCFSGRKKTTVPEKGPSRTLFFFTFYPNKPLEKHTDKVETPENTLKVDRLRVRLAVAVRGMHTCTRVPGQNLPVTVTLTVTLARTRTTLRRYPGTRVPGYPVPGYPDVYPSSRRNSDCVTD